MSRFLLCAAAVAAAWLPALVGAEPLSFDQAIRLAAQRSEAARARHAAAMSAAESSRAASQLPDPVFSAGIDNLPVTGPDRLSTNRESMTTKRVGFSQEWVSADKRAAREAAARAMAGVEEAQAAAAQAEARLQAAMAYVDAWYAGEALKLTTQAEHHLREELDTARARLAAAGGGSADMLQLAAAQGMAEDDSAEARQRQALAFASLQRWAGYRPDALATGPVFVMPTEADYVARHPEVAVTRRNVEVARGNATVAAQERHANWTWAVSYGQRTGYSDMVSIGVSIPLQIAPSQRQDRETAARLALVDKAEAELAEATRAATAEYQALSGDAERQAQRVVRFETAVTIPARQRTEALLAGYRSNQAPLSAVFEARRQALEAERKHLALQRELARIQAQLTFKPLAEGSVL
ncbi:TolC family protein [Roseateles sp. BYS78W]|uniref:TolC family protein n=1 Tax=Pelomonas candidula TaxID=3299025 RepID=A0ABW7HAI9_9BURK